MIPQTTLALRPSRLWRREPTKGSEERSRTCYGLDYRPSFPQIAFVDPDTHWMSERRLGHREQAEQFFRELKQRNLAMRVAMEFSDTRTLALVWAVAAGVAIRVVDRGRGRDPHQARAQAEDRSSGCAAVAAAEDDLREDGFPRLGITQVVADRGSSSRGE